MYAIYYINIASAFIVACKPSWSARLLDCGENCHFTAGNTHHAMMKNIVQNLTEVKPHWSQSQGKIS